MAKEITLDDKKKVIADTMISDVVFDKRVILTVCHYCGAKIKEYEKEHYDYHDSDTWVERHNYCTKQCDGVHAEYEKEKEIENAIKEIERKYSNKCQSTYNDSHVYFHATQQYRNEISKQHQRELEKINNRVNNIFDNNMEGAYIQIRKKD